MPLAAPNPIRQGYEASTSSFLIMRVGKGRRRGKEASLLVCGKNRGRERKKCPIWNASHGAREKKIEGSGVIYIITSRDAMKVFFFSLFFPAKPSFLSLPPSFPVLSRLWIGLEKEQQPQWCDQCDQIKLLIGGVAKSGHIVTA